MRHSYDFVIFVLKYALCRSKRSLKRLAVAFTSISSWVGCISGLLQKAKQRAKAPLNVALDFENRATRALLSCRNASYLHKGVLNRSAVLGSSRGNQQWYATVIWPKVRGGILPVRTASTRMFRARSY